MASLTNAGKSCSVITYDWWDKYDRSKCTREEEVKLCLIEVNEMYREGLEESPLTDAEYDFLMSCVDEELAVEDKLRNYIKYHLITWRNRKKLKNERLM